MIKEKIQELKERGYIKDISDESLLIKLLEAGNKAYIGFDPTAKSLHIGHLLPINLLIHLKSVGVEVIPLLGTATGMIGDPSGKKDERKLLLQNDVLENAKYIKVQLNNLIGEEKVHIKSNYDWLSKIDLLTFLRDYGKYISVTYMLNKEIVSSRLETGISYTEFSYMLLQSTDFHHLATNYKCLVQFGGSDQWGNITSGIELIRKKEGLEVAGGTIPLLLTSNGQKFGKSEGNALYLDKDMTSPYKVYQYFINSTDEDAYKYLKLFSFISLENIETLKESNELRIMQKTIAFEIIKQLHGIDEAENVKRISEILFSGNITKLSDSEIEECFEGTPSLTITESKNIIDVALELKVASSKSEIRKLIQAKGLFYNDKLVDNIEIMVDNKRFINILKKGKKNYFLIKSKY